MFNAFQMGTKLTALRCFPIAAAIFAPSVRAGCKNAVRGHFGSSSGHFGTTEQLIPRHCNAKIGKRNAYRSSQCEFCPLEPSVYLRISDKKTDRYANLSLYGALIKRGTTVHTLLNHCLSMQPCRSYFHTIKEQAG